MVGLQKNSKGFAVTFIQKLTAAWESNNSLLCVGLDPDMARLPVQFQHDPNGIYKFCTEIIDATADLACAFKPQIAYFAALSAERQLEDICNYVRENYPHIPLIMDSKRGDIGATAKQYAREAYDRYGADAVTVSPFMGSDSVEPYMEWKDRGVIVLCRTSNPGGSDLQFLQVDGKPLYQHVARLVGEVECQRPVCAGGGGDLPGGTGAGTCDRGRYAAAGAGCWRAGRGCGSDRDGRPDGKWHGHDDQFVARYSVRGPPGGRGLCCGGAARGANYAGCD